MGINYKVLLFDEMNWQYSKTSKWQYLARIEDELMREGYHSIDLEAEWYGFMVIDLEKIPAISVEVTDIILRNCEKAYYYTDVESYNLIELKI